MGLGVLVILSALCTVFVAGATAAEAWQEHEQAQWPEVTAHVQKCAMEQRRTGRRQGYRIHCRLTYLVGGEETFANIYSKSVPSREVWQYPPDQIAPFEDWVDAHPPETPIVVHYDPAQSTRVALVTTDMPGAGPRTHSNIKLLELCAASFVVLLILARLARPQSAAGYRRSRAAESSPS